MNLAYVRVSTIDQHDDRQVEALSVHGIDKWYMEKVSGKNTDREQLQLMLSEAKEGDTIFIHEFSRLARSTTDLLYIVEDLAKRNIRLVSNKEYVDTSTPTGKLMLTMIAAIAEFERTNLLERQREGIVAAKKRGAYKNCGRKYKEYDAEYLDKLLVDYENGLITKTEIANKLNVSRKTLYQILDRRATCGA